MFSVAWMWLYAGAFFILMELAVPGFVIFFFGLAAVAVGLCRFIFGEALDLSWQIGLFSFFSLFFIIALRRWLSGMFMGLSKKNEANFNDGDVGRIGRVTAKTSSRMTAIPKAGTLPRNKNAGSRTLSQPLRR